MTRAAPKGTALWQRAAMRAGLMAGAAFGKPIQAHGQKMDPMMSALVRFVRRLPPPAGMNGGPGAMAAVREQYAKAVGVTSLWAAPGVTVRDVAVPGPGAPLVGRLHQPNGPARGTLLFLHGGGFIMGSPLTHDGLCRHLCARTGLQVFAAPYRLAPEHPFPAAHDDARAALRWARGALPGRIAVGGDSAGANLAAGLALDGDVAAQLLLYPVVDMVGSAGLYPSLERFAEGYLLTADALEQCKQVFLPADTDLGQPRLSPVHADLAGAAPAVVVVAGFDPLCDQGRAYAAALQAAGRTVELLDETGLVHGFADFAGVVPEARRAVDRAADALMRVMG